MAYVKENLIHPAGTRALCHKDRSEFCIADDCMAWRWFPLQANAPEYIAALKVCENDRGMKPKEAAEYVNANRAEFGIPTKPFEGFCGLAGNP